MTHEAEPNTEHEILDDLPEADEIDAVTLTDVPIGEPPELDVDTDPDRWLDQGPADG